MRASASITTPGCAPFSTTSASTTNSPPPPIITRPAVSTRPCCTCSAHYEAVMAIMLPTLARGTRGDLFAVPADPSETGVVHAGSDRRHRRGARHARLARSRNRRELRDARSPAARCKLQWKPDWAMRWYALGVDYEMAGKDLIDSVKLSSRDRPRARRHAAGRIQLRIVPRREGPEDLQVQGQRPDHRGMADATRSPESLVPLHVSRSRARPSGSISTSIPRAVDDYLAFLDAYPRQETESSGSAIRPGTSIPARRRRRKSCVTGAGKEPRFPSACCSISPRWRTAKTPQVLWGFLRRYAPDVSPATHPRLDRLSAMRCAISAISCRPAKAYRARRRSGARGAWTLSDALAGLAAGRERGRDPGRALRYRAAIPRYQDMKAKGATPERPGVSNDWFAMLYAGAARRGSRTPLRLVRGPLWR